MKVRLTPRSLPILLALLAVVGCGSAADIMRERHDPTFAEEADSTTTSASTGNPRSRQADDLATNFRKAADDVERVAGEFQQGNHQRDQEAQALAGMAEIADDLTRIGEPQNWWISLIGIINEAVTSVRDDPDKPAVAVEYVSVERLDDLSNWFDSLPKSATEKLSDVDRRTPPTGAGWLLSLELNVDATDQIQTEMILAALLKQLRNSKRPDKLRLTHAVWKESGKKTVVEFAVRNE